MSAHASEAYAPKARVRYVPTSGPAKPALILHKVSDVDAYAVRLADGRRITIHASQIEAPATQLQPKVKGQSA